MPVPVSVTTCGEPVALSLKLSEPLKGPVVLGEKLTPTVQLAPTISVNDVPAQVPVPVLAKLPVTVMELTISDAVPLLVSVTN